MKVVFEKGKVSSDREIADDTFEKIRLAIKEKNSENVKVLFSTELQNSIESLGEDVKDFINLINTLISGATKLVDTFGSIPTTAGIFGIFAGIKNFGRPKMFGLKLLF